MNFRLPGIDPKIYPKLARFLSIDRHGHGPIPERY